MPVFSDECYAEFTWEGPPRTVLGHGGGAGGLDGVVAVHSLSKRSNLAGMRVGWYGGDPELVDYLREVRKHAGFMVPGPVAAGGRGGPPDDRPRRRQQRERYWERLVRARAILAGLGVDCDLPGGGFYLWAPAPGGDGWAWTRWLAERGGCWCRQDPSTDPGVTGLSAWPWSRPSNAWTWWRSASGSDHRGPRSGFPEHLYLVAVEVPAAELEPDPGQPPAG